MAESSALDQLKQKRFKRMMDEGAEAFKNGDHRLAHDIWREAATLDPYNEKVWMALYRVLDNDDDRRVCLQNMIAINPLNVGARRRLNKLESAAARETAVARQARIERFLQHKQTERARLQRVQRQNRRVLWRAIFIGIGAGVLAILGGIVASILLYAPR